MKMTIEPVSAFSSLDVLVAMDEGLFSAEGLDLRMATSTSRLLNADTGSIVIFIAVPLHS